ncbi:XVIPCD domain-containing protein [Luteimonas huabeiensis]|uniref:XVIPCD domain-containing protein n=1 Tax=Luteimonas huabeiensis TaxID=1244513 RepID=UPI00046787B7|nr:XVIPCD domain-containing protein [Luteimonas huabeiensis]
MGGLIEKDLKILGEYARDGNRELYWNYLAQTPGNDGYGLLALGVVRNDNMPGATANAYAQGHARVQQTRHGSEFADRNDISEREWDRFGQRLVEEDFKRREFYIERQRPELALNLPVRDVQDSHDQAFRDHQIDPNAWTPRILLEAARRQGGEAAAEQVWGDMLDNDARGLARAAATARHVAEHLPAPQRHRYARDVALAYAEAAVALPATDPDRIGARNVYYRREDEGRWSWVVEHSRGVSTMPVREPERLARLEDTHALRLEQQQRRQEFHPEDGYRPIARSPRLLVQAPEVETAPYLVAATAATRPSDLRDAGHPGHLQYQRAYERVRLFETQHGIAESAYSERLAASLSVLAKREGIDLDRAFVRGTVADGLALVERASAGGAGERRVGFDAAALSNRPIEASSRAWAALQSPHYASDAPPAARSPAQLQAIARLSPTDLALYARIREGAPAHIGDDHVLHALSQAREQGASDAGRVQRVAMAGDALWVQIAPPGWRAEVDVAAPAPAAAESLARIDAQHDRHAQQMHEASQRGQRAQEAALAI